MTHKTFLFSAIILSILATPALSLAQTTSVPADGLMPAVNAQTAATPQADGEETHPVLNLMPDKSELVRLDRDAGSVIVGNPAYATVVLDTPRLAVVIPRTSGATYFTVLDKQGNVIMQRHVVVSAPKKNYVRVRRSCANAATGTNCQPTSVYFCPDMCHEIGADATTDSAGTTAPAVSAP